MSLFLPVATKKLLTSACDGDSLSAANLVIDGLARYAEKASFG